MMHPTRRVIVKLLCMLAAVTALGLTAPRSARADQVSANPDWFLPQGANLQMDNAGNTITLIGTSLYKLDAAGNTLWGVAMPPAPGNNPFLNSGCHIIVDSANNIYVDSFYDNRSDNSRLVLTKISPSGVVAWGGPKTYSIGPVNSSEHMTVGPMVIGSDGSVYAVGHSGMASQQTQPTTLLRISPTTGAEVNRRALTDTNDAGRGMPDTTLAADRAGNIYYGGPQGLWSFSTNLQTQRWTRGSISVRALAVDRWNNVYATGVAAQPSQIYNMFVMRLNNANGNVVWTTSFNGQSRQFAYPADWLAPSDDDRTFGGNIIALDSAGQVYAAGYASDSTGYNGGMVAKLAPNNGALLWTQHYGPTNAGAAVMALAVDDKDNLYVSGQQTRRGYASPLQAAREIMTSAGLLLWILPSYNVLDETINYEYVDQVVVDKRGNAYWGTASFFVQGGGEFAYYKFITSGRVATAITTPGTGKSKVLMDTFNHNNVLLETFSAADVLQAGTTNWNQTVYGQSDRDIAGGPDGSVRILQNREADGTNSASATLVIRNDAGTQISSNTFNLTNMRATNITVGSDNKPYILFRSTVDGSATVWRLSANGATIERNSTFTNSVDRAPVGLAVDGITQVWLIWQGLDGTIYPWNLKTSLAINTQNVTLNGSGYQVVGADVGADRNLRILGTNKTTRDFSEWTLSSSGGLVSSQSYAFGGSWPACDLSVGSDNRLHILSNDIIFDEYQYAVTNSSGVLQSFVQFSTPAP